MIHILVILIILDRYLLLFTTTLRYLQETWSGPRVDKLLHFVITFLNSSFEKISHSKEGFEKISSKSHRFTWQFCAKLKVWYKACQKSLSLMQGHLLYWKVSVVESFYFLIQFMRSQSLLFLDIISWIFLSKNKHLVCLTNLLNFFQSSSDLDKW